MGAVGHVLGVIDRPAPAVAAACVVLLVVRMGDHFVTGLGVLAGQQLLQSNDTGDQE